MKALLIGMPNVGKSVIFNKLTGLNAGIGNYAGTTVEYTYGQMQHEGFVIEVIDVPGTYSLDASNEAEKLAIDMLQSNPDAVICVLDAINLESSIFLLMQVMEKNVPVSVVLNRVDVAKNKGIDIDTAKLSELLKLNIIPAIATKGQGITELKNEIISLAKSPVKDFPKTKACWKNAEKITELVSFSKQVQTEKQAKFKFEDFIVKPFPGIIIAIVLLIISFALVIGIGMSLRRFLLLPVFRGLVFPYLIAGVEMIFKEGFFHNILIGEYGFLIKGIEWPITLVLPYIFSFYLALSILEDSGYLPRLSILLDGLLNKIGLSGANIIPIILGYGCTIPAITATRAMNTRKERLIVVTMVSLSVPCVSQTGVFISLLGEQSILIVLALFLLSFIVAIICGFVSNLIIKGDRKPLTLVEVPALLAPDLSILSKKMWLRVKGYLTGGAITMFYAIFFTSLLYETGFFTIFGKIMSPVVVNWLRLPHEAAIPLILGVVRRELAVLPLLEMNLTSLQLFVGSVVALFYVPCIAVIAMLLKEFGFKVAILIFLLTMIVSFAVGGLIANIGLIFFN